MIQTYSLVGPHVVMSSTYQDFLILLNLFCQFRMSFFTNVQTCIDCWVKQKWRLLKSEFCPCEPQCLTFCESLVFIQWNGSASLSGLRMSICKHCLFHIICSDNWAYSVSHHVQFCSGGNTSMTAFKNKQLLFSRDDASKTIRTFVPKQNYL